MRRPEELEPDEIRRLVDSVPVWWHSIDLGHGVVTPGVNDLGFLRSEWALMDLPDLAGRSVLDIGAWDGYFSFEAERHGAARVLALDHYVWSLDLAGQQRYYHRCRREGESPRPYHLTEFWKPDELPGKRGIDVAHRVLGSEVEVVVDDYMTGDPMRFGAFDVVLYLGVLYHMEDPLGALRRVAASTRDLAVISTQACVTSDLEDRALVEFYPGAELENDVSNWWAPNLEALRGLCRAAGFARTETVLGPPAELPEGESLGRYRAMVRAYKADP